MRERVAPSGPSLGIRVEGEDAGLIFNSIYDAGWSADKLAADGYQNVAVFDRLTGQTIRTLESFAAPLKRRE